MSTTRPLLQKAGNFAERTVFWYRFASAGIGLFVLLLALWTQYLGPGIQSRMQEFLGVTEIRVELENLSDITTPPRVVNWERVFQIGDCNQDNCNYFLGFSRTDYGVDCGIPTVRAEMRIGNAQIVNLNLDGFQPIEGTLRGTSVEVPLDIPSFIAPGTYQWRMENIYPTCPWKREPIPRFSPWWDLVITE